MIYFVLPAAVYNGLAIIPAHTDPVTQQAMAVHNIYTDEGGNPITFAEKFPVPIARPHPDGSKFMFKTKTCTDEEMFGVNILIAQAGESREDRDGNFKYGVLNEGLVGEYLARSDWDPEE